MSDLYDGLGNSKPTKLPTNLKLSNLFLNLSTLRLWVLTWISCSKDMKDIYMWVYPIFGCSKLQYRLIHNNIQCCGHCDQPGHVQQEVLVCQWLSNLAILFLHCSIQQVSSLLTTITNIIKELMLFCKPGATKEIKLTCALGDIVEEEILCMCSTVLEIESGGRW